MAIKWFAVKTLYRSQTNDRPEKPDLFYDPDATLLEERILLIKAKSRAEAVHKAEREARDYARKGECENPYRQRISTDYIGYCDVFEIGGALADKTEIFLNTRLVSRRITDRKLARIYTTRAPQQQVKTKWKKFMNRDYTPKEKP